MVQPISDIPFIRIKAAELHEYPTDAFRYSEGEIVKNLILHWIQLLFHLSKKFVPFALTKQ
jgi:hypothetical protein